MNAPLSHPERPSFIQEAVPQRVGGGGRLTAAQVEEIRASTERGGTLAARFGVAESTISRVRRNLAYVDPALPDVPSRVSRTEKGVTFDPRSEKWRVRIQRDGKRLPLGYFATEAEAVEARREALTALEPLSYEMRAWIARRKREIAGEPLTLADREQLRRHLEDL